MRVLICGAGVAGLTAAACLRRDGHDVIVVERAPRLRDQGYMIDFMGSGFDACERLGLLPDLERLHYPVDRLVFMDAAGRERASMSYPALRSRMLRNRHFNFMRGDLEQVLYETSGGPGSVRFGTTVSAFEEDRELVRVVLSDGTMEAVDLLVGADGVHSTVRRIWWGHESAFMRAMGYVAAAFVVADPTAARRVGRTLLTMTAPNRQVSIYPLPDGRVATFFLHKGAELVSRVSACGELRRVYGDFGSIVPRLLDHCSQSGSVYFDPVVQVEMDGWSRGRVVLVGDACQCVSPLAGQGASMAVAGAYVLAEELRARATLDEALTRYERRIRPVIENQQEAGRRMARWFVPASPMWLAFRNFVLRASTWPVIASVIGHRMAAASIFSSPSVRGTG